MNGEMKAKLAKYMQSNGYYDIEAIAADELEDDPLGLNATMMTYFGSDDESPVQDSELVAAAKAYNASIAAERDFQAAETVTIDFEGDDHVSGYIVTIPVLSNEPSPIVAFLRSMQWTREDETAEDFEFSPNSQSSSYYGGFLSGDNGHVWKNEDGEWCYCFSGISDDGNYYEGGGAEGFKTKAEAVAEMMDAYRNY